MHSGGFVFITMLVSFLIDRVTKFYISGFNIKSEFFLIDLGFLSITRVYNTGAAFGILQNNTLFLAIFSFLVIILLTGYVLRNSKKLDAVQSVGFGLILGGTAGNLIDRLFYGHVVDFIKLNFVDFPVFNMADLFINIGVALILITLMTVKQETRPKNK